MFEFRGSANRTLCFVNLNLSDFITQKRYQISNQNKLRDNETRQMRHKIQMLWEKAFSKL